jgi:hypothetical protein
VQVVLVHQPPDLLVVDDDAPLAQRSTDAAIAVELEVVSDREHGFNDGGVIRRSLRSVLESRTSDPHQPASFGNGDAAGAMIAT